MAWQQEFEDTFNIAKIPDKNQIIKTVLNYLIQWANVNYSSLKIRPMIHKNKIQLQTRIVMLPLLNEHTYINIKKTKPFKMSFFNRKNCDLLRSQYNDCYGRRVVDSESRTKLGQFK